MKNKVEKRLNLKIVTIGNSFLSVLNRYKEESILRDSKNLAEFFVINQEISDISSEDYTGTDLFIICCNADNELEKETANDLLIKAKENGSDFFTSVVITYGSATDDDFKSANVIFPIDKASKFRIECG